ncbi:MAG: hypothetical protein IPL61_03330 [Myxococcales bacterium]|nr:hypothetical protein [Myxococcales bacterium]
MWFVAAIAARALVGCSDNPVGRICDLGLDDPGLNQAVVGSPSLDCPTRTCLKVPKVNPDTPEGFQPLSANKGMCTATCESDSDCDKVPESPCVTGFACGVALTVGPFCCQKFCICKDYVVIPDSGKLPDPLACDGDNANNICCNLPGRVGNPTYPNCPG